MVVLSDFFLSMVLCVDFTNITEGKIKVEERKLLFKNVLKRLKNII